MVTLAARLVLQAAILLLAQRLFAETPDETEHQVAVAFLAGSLVLELLLHGGVRVWRTRRSR